MVFTRYNNEGRTISEIPTVKFPDLMSGFILLVMILSINELLTGFILVGMVIVGRINKFQVSSFIIQHKT